MGARTDLSPDPVGFAQGGPGYFNRYAYVGNDPVNMVDPTGMYEIFVGGNRDRIYQPMQELQGRYARENPQRTSAFVRHGDRGRLGAELARALAQQLETGEPINVICHSLGCATAMRVLHDTNIAVDTLVTLDPVDDLLPDSDQGRPSLVGEWRNVETDPGRPNISDRIRQLGDTVNLGDFDVSGADDNATLPLHSRCSPLPARTAARLSKRSMTVIIEGGEMGTRNQRPRRSIQIGVIACLFVLGGCVALPEIEAAGWSEISPGEMPMGGPEPGVAERYRISYYRLRMRIVRPSGLRDWREFGSHGGIIENCEESENSTSDIADVNCTGDECYYEVFLTNKDFYELRSSPEAEELMLCVSVTNGYGYFGESNEAVFEIPLSEIPPPRSPDDDPVP